MNIADIKELTKNVEANIIGCLYTNPAYYFDYKDVLSSKDFFNDDWRFFFIIGKKMVEKGFEELKASDVATFIEQSASEGIKLRFEKYGYLSAVEELHGIFNPNNMKAYVDNLKKWSALHQISDRLSINADTDITKFKNMSLSDVYDIYTAKLNDIFVNINDDVHTQSIADGLDELIENANKGLKKGLPINSPMLSQTINGINLGQITLIGGQSGSGKSTFLIQQLLTAVFEKEEAAVFFLNEQDAPKFQQEMLTWIINNIVITDRNKSFNKIRWRDGGFTEEEFKWLHTAADILRQKTKNNRIIIVEFKTYTHSTVVRSIKKYAAMGVKIFAIDTFKLSADADANELFWLTMQTQMKELDDLVKPSNLNVALVCTLQLGKGAITNRYLSANDLGMSKNVIDVASVCLLIRKVHADEYPGEKNEIEVYMPIEGTESKTQVQLDPKKRHSVIFIEKNRNGVSNEFQIVAYHNFGTFEYKEMGMCNISMS